MKKQLPLFLGLVVGFFALAEFYIPAHQVSTVQERLLGFAQVLAAAAFVLGGINVLQVNWPKIRRREQDWVFKVVLLVGAVGMGLVGVRWHSFGGEPSAGQVVVSAGGPTAEAILRVEGGRPGALLKVDGVVPEGFAGLPHEMAVLPGTRQVQVYMPIAGYDELREELSVEAGTQVAVRAELGMQWGPTGRVYTWLYDHVFAPCNATMFALLAFFIASAAFRAFRARNTEAALLLGAAILIMLGRAPIGRAISDMLPLVADWIIDVPNNAGRRAIMMGAALGAIATGLRVILGLERSHLGSE
jgi:hypothetical protein